MKPNHFFNAFFAALAAAIFLLAGCQPGEPQQNTPNPKSKLLGTWELADMENIRMEQVAANSEAEKAASDAVEKEMEDDGMHVVESSEATKAMGGQIIDLTKGQMLKNGLALSFFSDGTYTKVSGDGRKVGERVRVFAYSDIDFMNIEGSRYAYGQWKASGNNSKLTLTPQGGAEAETHDVLSFDDKFLTLHLAKDNFSCDFKLRRTGQPLKDLTADPFYAANNQWRVAPAAPETEPQLRARLKNHVQHYLTLLEASLEREQNSVSLKYSPSIIQIYSGGIGIREKQYWDAAFIQCFHSPQDAQKGVDLYTKILDKNLSIGAGTGDWVKDDANLLRLLLTELQ